MAQMQIKVSAIENVLLGEDSVDECAVRLREVPGSSSKIVAYVVTRNGFVADRWQSYLETKLPAQLLPHAYVPLTALPFNDEGQIDEQTLASYAVIDEEFVRTWESNLNALPQIERATLVIEDWKPTNRAVHLSDLLGDEDANLPDENPSNIQATVAVAETRTVNEKPAISVGPSLIAEPPATLAAALKAAADYIPSHGIVYIDSEGVETTQSYEGLLEDAERILGSLRKLGLKPGDKVIFQLQRNRDFVPAFWACALGGFVSVPISIAPSYKELNATVTKLFHTWEMLDHPIILTTESLKNAIAALPDLWQSEKLNAAAIEELMSAERDHEWHQGDPDDVALILLTSGSTGLPKGVMLSNRNILSRSAGVAQLDQLTANDVSFNWFPLDHVGGIVMFHTLAVYLKAKQLLAPTEMILQEPLQWLDVIDKHRVTVTWAPNFAFGLVNEQEEEINNRKWDLSCLNFILNGGEAIVAKTSRRFLELLAPHGLPATAIHPAWGMSETSSGITSSHKFEPDTTSNDMSFVEVGEPIPGVSLRIVDNQDQLLNVEKIGRLQVQGSTITRGYYNNEQLNREAFSSDGWFNTGDLGFLRDGCLTITGRTKDVIIINGANFYSHEIEAVVEEVKGVNVSFTAATAVRDHGVDTDRLAIFFSPIETTHQYHVIADIKTHVFNQIGVNPDYVIPVEKELIPKTAIGKIQRQHLRDRFEAGDFKQHLKQVDVETQNARTLPDWFYRKTWTRRDAPITSAESGRGRYLVFSDNKGLGKLLVHELHKSGAAFVLVEQGAEFNKNDSSHYEINPVDAEHYRRLIKALETDKFTVDQVLHLWQYTEFSNQPVGLSEIDEAQTLGVYSLINLVQALAVDHDSEKKVRLTVVANYSQPVTAGDAIVPEKSTVFGLLKTLPLELSWLEPRHIDLQNENNEVNAACVWRELAVVKTRTEVAYRNSKRFTAALTKMDIADQKTQDVPIKDGGVYLISGGLGGVGTELAQFLLKKYSAKLIVIGKTELPPRADWNKQNATPGILSRRIKNLRAIEAVAEATDGSVVYRAVDVCDLEALRQAIHDAEKIWDQQLAGVFHLAGEGNLEHHWNVMDEHWVVSETRQTFEWMFRPKVYGSWSLHQLIKDRPDALFVLFSSVNSIFGGATFSAYSAANSFLDNYVFHLRNTTHARSYCFNWTMWDETGMSEGNPQFARESARNTGFFIMSKEHALNSLIAGLRRTEPQIVIGVDASSRHGQRHINQKARARQSLSAYFQVRKDAGASALNELLMRDVFGHDVECRLNQVSELALMESGEVDRDRLGELQRANQKSIREVVLPRTEVEREIANIWQEVLRLPQVSIHDNFFQIGGQSLLATKVISRLRKAFQIDVPMRSFFEMSTVAQLSKTVDESRNSTAGRKVSQITPVSRDAYRERRGGPQESQLKRRVN